MDLLDAIPGSGHVQLPPGLVSQQQHELSEATGTILHGPFLPPQALWPRLRNLKWMHSSSAGLEHLLFPELVDSPVPLTNARGVYSNSLAEYTLTACNWFAKDLPRLRRQQAGAQWEPYDVEELRGRTLGVVG